MLLEKKLIPPKDLGICSVSKIQRAELFLMEHGERLGVSNKEGNGKQDEEKAGRKED